MGLFNRQEHLPERRDGTRVRRGKKIGRTARWKYSMWALRLLPALLFLGYLSFSKDLLPNRLHLDRDKHDGLGDSVGTPTSQSLDLNSGNINNSSLDSVQTERLLKSDEDPRSFQFKVPKLAKDKHRKRYYPCELSFLESVEDLLQPRDYMNYTNFFLKFISNDVRFDQHSLNEPRFAGHQTLEERKDSFYATNQTLHCGFVKDSKEYHGFQLNEKDKEYMQTCKVAVSSCIFGSSDYLRRPTTKKISEYSKKNVCFVMFLDEMTMSKLSSEGQVPDDRGYIGLWRIVIVKNLPYIDMRKTGKVPKFLSHRLFPSARYSIWIDSKLRLNADPMQILEYFLWRKKSEYAISNHYDRHCVWEEVLQNKRLNKYNHTAIDEQFNFYQLDGLVKFNDSDKDKALPSYVPEGSFIIRAHTPMSNLFSCLWFNEVDRFTSRDQLSFAYTFLKLTRTNPEKPFHLNMFKDCERRALAKLFHHRAESSPPPPFL